MGQTAVANPACGEVVVVTAFVVVVVAAEDDELTDVVVPGGVDVFLLPHAATTIASAATMHKIDVDLPEKALMSRAWTPGYYANRDQRPD